SLTLWSRFDKSDSTLVRRSRSSNLDHKVSEGFATLTSAVQRLADAQSKRSQTNWPMIITVVFGSFAVAASLASGGSLYVSSTVRPAEIAIEHAQAERVRLQSEIADVRSRYRALINEEIAEYAKLANQQDSTLAEKVESLHGRSVAIESQLNSRGEWMQSIGERIATLEAAK
ncbi:MAG: hypothetical protein AAFP69_05880, partial [Planctomycetota bacterium]